MTMVPGWTVVATFTVPLAAESLNRTASTLKNLSATPAFNQLTVERSQLLPLVPDQTSEAGGGPTTFNNTVPGVAVEKETVWRVPAGPLQARLAALPVVELPPLMRV